MGRIIFDDLEEEERPDYGGHLVRVCTGICCGVTVSLQSVYCCGLYLPKVPR